MAHYGSERPLKTLAALCFGAMVLLSACSIATGDVATENRVAETGDVEPAGFTDTEPLPINDDDSPLEVAPPTPAASTPVPVRPVPEVSTPVPAVVPAGSTVHDLGSYRLALPDEWTVIANLADLDEILDVGADVMGLPPGAMDEYRALLEDGNGVAAIAFGGDNFNSFRQAGTDLSLSNPTFVEAQYTLQFESFAQNVSFQATPRLFGDTAGLFVRGEYEISGQTVHMYQFNTENDGHVYYFTVTLFSGSDPAIADAIFNSVVFTS